MRALAARGFRPRRKRGQNFLFDRQLLDALIADAGVPAGARVLEIGAGVGTLTERLLARGFSVVAVEIEPALVELFSEVIVPDRVVRPGASVAPSSGPCTLIATDVLERKSRLNPLVLEVLAERPGPFHVVANLPYAIATPVLQLLLELERPRLESFGVLVQREAAERWVAPPGRREYGAMTVLLSLLGDGEVTRRVGRDLFWPRPNVDSVFFRWRARPVAPDQPRWGEDLQAVRDLAASLFTGRRKMLRNHLRSLLSPDDPEWEAMGVNPRWRPEDVPPDRFLLLARRWADRRE